MVCSACGYENQAGNRFCGMCGTPLPHPPLTAPGAQGTHSLTRMPVPAANPSEHQPVEAKPSATNTPSPTGVLIEVLSTESRGREPSQPENLGASTPDMVPAVPLEDYIKNFRYIPPASPEEITMRGDAHVSQPEAPVASDPSAPAANRAVSAENTSETLPAESTKDVDDRLGLEAMAEEPSPSPRFLDVVGLPARPRKPATRTSDMVVPSFLGLNDPPQISTETGDAVEVIRTKILQQQPGKFEVALHSRWRVWLAVAMVLLFAGSGFFEWRSLIQTDNSSVAAIKTKIQTLWQDISSSPGEAPPPSPPVVPADVSTPKVAPEEPSKGPERTAAVQSNPSPPANQNEPPVTPQTSVSNANSPDHAAGQPVAGADEVAKANAASDSAATAAWLWKATAKGNPDAPVRLADRYIKGDGVPRSCEQALVLLKTAATKENARARNRLAALYNSGTCVQRNRVEAYRWLSSALAADPNSHWAQENRELIWQEMTAAERAAAQPYR